MELASHIFIGHQIADALSLSPLCRKAFIFGCIEPDCVMVTYLRGAAKGKGIHGHCWENIRKCITSLIDKCDGRTGVLASFRLGRLCHYLVDAFTHPHNACFAGTLSEHMAYEDDLTVYLKDNIGNLRVSPSSVTGFSFSWVSRLHDSYMSENPSMGRDAFYALYASFTASYALQGIAQEAVLA